MNTKAERIAIPKYQQVSEYIMNKIQGGEYKPGDQIPTENELIKQFKVSRIVIINSLSRLVSEGVVVRIPGRGTFVADSIAGKGLDAVSASSGHVPSGAHISFILPRIDFYHSSTLVDIITRQAYEAGLFCSILYSDNSIELEEKLIDFIAGQNSLGLILYPANQETYNKRLMNLSNSNFPVVLVDRDLPGLGLSCVQTDNKMATEMATEHLIRSGHKKIGICSQTPMPTMSISNRIDGFLSKMKENNIFIDPSLLLTEMNAKDSAPQLIRIVREKIATALICLTQYDYYLVYNVLKSEGFSIPQDISLIAIDNPDINSDYTEIKTTHVSQNSDMIGLNAFTLLKEMIESKKPIEKKILIPPTFVDGNTIQVISEG